MDKKKIIYILSGIMGIMIIFIGLIALVNSCSSKTLSYDKIEEKLKVSAIAYAEDNISLLPSDEGASVIVEDSTLINGGYIKALSELVDEGVSCSAKVTITKNGNKYLYSPILNCGEKYKTQKFIDVIMSNNSIVTNGAGLYKSNNLYTFKGEIVNNYIELLILIMMVMHV